MTEVSLTSRMAIAPAVSLSVILPAKGRMSLAAAATSVLPGMEPEDQLVIVGDANYDQTYARGVAKLAAGMTVGQVRYVETANGRSRFGNWQRDQGMRHAQGSHLLFLDDDDAYTPDALSMVREAVSDAPSAVHVFKARWGQGHHWQGVLWGEPEWREGNVGTPMVCWPHEPPMPSWMDWNHLGTVSDFGWMTAALGGREPVWHEGIVCEVRP